MPSPLPRSSWFACFKPDAAAPARLWCLPFAGGGTTPWFPYSQRFTGMAELVAVRPAGRESRIGEPPLRDFGALATAITTALAPHVRAADVLCGHSLGALLAFEVARGLRARGAAGPRALIAAGVRAPDLPRREPDVSQLDDEAFLTEVDQRYGGLPPEVRTDPELRELALPALRGDMAAYESYAYAPGTPLTTPVLTINSERDPTVNADEIAGWAKHTTNRWVSKIVPGGHMFIMSEAPAVSDAIREFLGAEALNHR